MAKKECTRFQFKYSECSSVDRFYYESLRANGKYEFLKRDSLKIIALNKEFRISFNRFARCSCLICLSNSATSLNES